MLHYFRLLDPKADLLNEIVDFDLFGAERAERVDVA